MNVRKIIARLNAQTIRFNIGRGGIPELTNQDIAAAVGMIHDQFAREVFCAIWWPEGSCLDTRALIRNVALAHRGVLDKQMRAEQVARLELHIAQENYAAKKFRTPNDAAELERLARKIEVLRNSHWPMQPTIYPVLREAVIREIAEPNKCATCDGRGTIVEGELSKVCPSCEGRCVVPVTMTKRATTLGMSLNGYKKSWKKVYEWTYDLISRKENEAAKKLAEVLQ